jgi:hypothetical protein
MGGLVDMKLRLRMFAWMVAVFGAAGWAVAAEPQTSFVSYRELENTVRSQSAELEELRARLTSLEREIVQADAGSPGGHVGPCCETVCTPQRCSDPAVYGGAEVVWFKPHFRGATAASIVSATGIDFEPLDSDFEVSGRYWLGVRGPDGFGARVRYWEWEHLTDVQSGVVPPGSLAFSGGGLPGTLMLGTAAVTAVPGETLEVFHRLEMHTLDFEVTQDFQLGAAALRVGGGLRYLRLNQLFGADAFDGPGLPESVRYRQSFEGIGPTISAEILRPICWNLSLYAQVRGAVTFGDRNERVDYIVIGGMSDTSSRSGADDMISVGELGIGLQADFGSLFVRGGYEGQIWWNAGSPNEGVGDMGLHGVVISAGLSF